MNIYLRTLLFLALLVSLVACADPTPPKSVAISEICQLDSGTNVTAEGFLSLPVSALICQNGQCKITFYDQAGSVPVEFVTSEQATPGKLTLPPKQYTLDDLQVTSADGTLVDRGTKVKITGPVRKQGANCYLAAYATELP
jgi:hypothetical protein